MARFTPTPEQEAALRLYQEGGSLRLEAGAGTGKTSTLQLLAESDPRRSQLYLAYNKAAAQDAQRRFGASVKCMTAHGWAYRQLRASSDPTARTVMSRLNAPRASYTELARLLHITTAFRTDEKMLQPRTLARLAKETVQQWCYSGDEEITRAHVPQVEGLDVIAHRELCRKVVPWALELWRCSTTSAAGFRTEHDHYLKLYSLRGGSWGFDSILLDEAQDANGVVVHMMQRQMQLGTQLVAVGDRSQSIYGWRGAVDAMTQLPITATAQLTQSFRFGQAIADEANKWLDLAGADLRLTGNPAMTSSVHALTAAPQAVLCRTNAAGVRELIAALGEGRKAALVGGGEDVARFAAAAEELMATGSSTHPDLCAFTSWGQVQDYVDDGGSDLGTLVKLVDEYTPAIIRSILDRCSDEAHADMVVSTAHRSKGREWEAVQIGNDFVVDLEEPPSREESMLAYVAVTRARQLLGRGSLAAVDQLSSDSPAPQPIAAPQETRDSAAAQRGTFDDLVPLWGNTPTGDDPLPGLEPEPASGELQVTLGVGLAKDVRAMAAATGKSPEEVVEAIIVGGMATLKMVLPQRP